MAVLQASWRPARHKGVYGNVIRTGLMLNAGKPEVDEMVAAIDAGLTVGAKVAKEASTSDAKSA